LGVIAGLLAYLLVATGARADDTHYRSIPIGAHAIGLGTAFTGVADDASAAYFNPAGLALDETRGLAAGLVINAWERFSLKDAFSEPDGTANAKLKTNRTVPIFVGAVLKFGPKDVLGQKKYAFALSVVEPIFSSGDTFIELESDPLALTDTYELDENDRATWYGLSFAGRLNLKQSIGASLYLSVRKLNHSEVGLALNGGMSVPASLDTFVGTSTAANHQRLGMKAFHFVMRFGWLYRIKPQLQLGVMLQFPGIPLKQTADVTSQRFVNDNRNPTTPLATDAVFFDDKVKGRLPLPAELEGGLEYWPAEKVMLAFDAAFYAPVRSQQRVELSDPVPVGGLFFDRDTKRRAIGNVAIAGDFFISKKLKIETGFFTDLSSAPGIPANPDRYYVPQVNRFGGSLTFGLNVARIALAVGSTFIYGKGDATGVVVDSSALLLEYTRTQATSRIIYLHITGATRAVSELSEKTTHRLKAHRASKKANRHETESRGPEPGREPVEAH